MVKMMSLLMVALVALTISSELRSTTARKRPSGPLEVQQDQVAATTNNVGHESVPIFTGSKNAVINPQMLPVVEAAPTNVVNPQDVNRAIPSGPRPLSPREVIIPQHCVCCGWYYSKYFTNCNKICCV